MVMNIRVLTPDRVICSTTADEVVLPGLTGQVGVLDGHAALITALDTGLLRIKLNEKWTPIILCGGLAEIDRNRVTVLVNDVEELSNVELSEATKELEKATLAVENAESSKARLDASVELKKATARLEAVNYLLKKGHRCIGLINGPQALTASEERKRGYFNAITKNRLKFDPSLIVSCDLTEKGTQEALDSLLDNEEISAAVYSPLPLSFINSL